jgi:hypothetical protein
MGLADPSAVVASRTELRDSAYMPVVGRFDCGRVSGWYVDVNVAYLRDDEKMEIVACAGSGVHRPRNERRGLRLDHSFRSELKLTDYRRRRPRRSWTGEGFALRISGTAGTRRSATSGTGGELDHITVRSIDDHLSQRGAVETQVGHNFGKALSVQLGEHGVNDIH